MSNKREGLRERIAEVLAEALAVFIQHGVCDLQDPYDAKRFDEYLNTLLSLLTQAQGYPYEDDNGKTHWEGCWRERGHHNCAVAMVERLTQAQEPVGYVVRLNPSAGSPLPWMFRERGQQLPPSNDGWEVVPVYTEPVGASPVASAPRREDEAHAAGMMAATHDAHSQLADVAGRMKVYGYDAETLRVLTGHIFDGAEIPMPASAPVWPEPGAPAPATKPPLGKIRPSAPEEEREARVLEIRADTCDRLVEALCTISAPDSYAEEYGQHAGAHYMDGVSVCIREIQRLSPRATQREGGEG